MLRRNRDGLTWHLGWGAAGAVMVLAAAACVAVAGVGPLRGLADATTADDTTTGAKAPPVADVQGEPLPAGALARMGSTRWRHGSTISFVAFGPDDRTLITAGQDNTVRLWDMATGKELRRFARPAPAGARSAPGRQGGVLTPVPVPPKPAGEAQVDAARAEALSARARAAIAEAEAALAEAKKQRDAAKTTDEAAAAKAKFDDVKRRIEAVRAQQEAAAKAQLEAQLRQRLAGGSPGSLAVAVAHDGKTIAVAGSDAVQLYEVESGKELGKITPPQVGVATLLFSPDGKTLAGHATDGGLFLWDASTGKERHQLKAPPQPENNRNRVTFLRAGNDPPGMAFTPDGTGFIVATLEAKEQNVTGKITLWDVTSGKERRDVKTVEGAAVGSVAVAPGGKVIAYTSVGVVHACKVDAGDVLFQTRLNEPASGVTFSPDGKTLAVRGITQQIHVLDAENGKELFVLGELPAGRALSGGVAVAIPRPITIAPEIRNFAFTSDGKRIATAPGGTIRLWNVGTGKELSLSEGHSTPVIGSVVSPDGKTVVSWGTDRTIRRWEAATGKPLGVFPLPTATATAVSPDGGTVATSGVDGTIRLYDTNGGKELMQIKSNQRGASALAFSPDGKLLAERGGDASIRIYDLTKGGGARQLASQPVANPVPAGVVVLGGGGRFPGGVGTGIVFSPDGKLLATPGSAASDPRARTTRSTINLIDVSTGKAIRKIELSLPVVSYAFSPDGRTLATENADESVTLWEVASGKERARLGQVATPTAPPAATGLVPTPQVAVARVGGVGQSGPDGTPTTLAFSPDGRVLVGRAAGFVRVWDVDAGKELARFKGHDGRVETIGFSPDGKAVVSGSTDTTLLLWDAAALLKGLAARQVADLPNGAADALWADLAGEDATKARESVLKLATSPRQAVPLLRERLKPTAAIDQQKLAGWITDLESNRFAVRQEAIANLVKAGEQAVPAVQKLLASQPVLETRLRAEELLDKLTGGTLTAEQLRYVRAVETLERIGTPEARTVLKALAGGASGALPTREAGAALERLPQK